MLNVEDIMVLKICGWFFLLLNFFVDVDIILKWNKNIKFV